MVDPSGAYLVLMDTTQVPCPLTQIDDTNWRAVPETTYAAVNSGYSNYGAMLAGIRSYSDLRQDIDSTQVDKAIVDVLPAGVTVGFQIPDGSVLTPSQ